MDTAVYHLLRPQHGVWKHPAELITADVEAFLNDLVVRRGLSASAQNQALCALVFLYSKVLENIIPQDHLGKFLLQRSRRPKRIPTVLSADEVQRVIAAIPEDSNFRLPVELLYGTGMRVSEVCMLRIRDIDLGRAQIIIRAGKGDKDRLVMLPASLQRRLGEQVAAAGQLWKQDVRCGGGYAPVPESLQHKRPRAGYELPGKWCVHRSPFLGAGELLRRAPVGDEDSASPRLTVGCAYFSRPVSTPHDATAPRRAEGRSPLLSWRSSRRERYGRGRELFFCALCAFWGSIF